MNLASLVDRHPGDLRALCDEEGWIDWGTVRRRAASVAGWLSSNGIGPGDRVVIGWPTSVSFVVAYLGALAAGAVVVPLNPTSPEGELERELTVADPSALLCSASCSEAIANALGRRDAAPLLVSPGLELDWEEISSPGARGGEALQPTERSSSDPAVLLFTSGTAGSPKLAELTHGNLLANLQQMLAVPSSMLSREDVGLAAVPLFHIFGLNVVLGLTLATGAGLVCEERFDPAEALTLVKDREVSVIAGAPPMFSLWSDLADSSEGKYDKAFTGTRLLLSGASALSPERAKHFEEVFGRPLWEGYGLTEASPAVATAVGLNAPKPGSVGKPLPGVLVRLVDESGEDALTDDPGEIWVSGPNIFRGYWRDEESTASVLDSEGWLHTGDIGVIDGSGELHVVDRLKDLIIVSGFNVVPSEVEEVLMGIEGITDVVVVGKPDPRTGESVGAVVVTSPTAPLTESEVVEAAGKHLAHYKVPKTVRFVEEIPHGLGGKAIRRFAREEIGTNS